MALSRSKGGNGGGGSSIVDLSATSFHSLLYQRIPIVNRVDFEVLRLAPTRRPRWRNDTSGAGDRGLACGDGHRPRDHSHRRIPIPESQNPSCRNTKGNKM